VLLTYTHYSSHTDDPRHCTGGSESSGAKSCNATARDYNIPLRVGLLFVIMLTSAIGVFTPILTTRFNLISQTNIIFVILKQFGTGIVISTAFVHLFTHAELMFGNECLGELKYEGTTAAIFMAGLILSFIIDYLGARFVQWRQKKHVGSSAEVPTAASDDKSAGASATASTNSDTDVAHHHGHSHGNMRTATPMEEKINVLNLEAGIIFHSIRKFILCGMIAHRSQWPSHWYHARRCRRHLLRHALRCHPFSPDVRGNRAWYLHC
jgi:zinc transporter 1/2/3